MTYWHWEEMLIPKDLHYNRTEAPVNVQTRDDIPQPAHYPFA